MIDDDVVARQNLFYVVDQSEEALILDGTPSVLESGMVRMQTFLVCCCAGPKLDCAWVLGEKGLHKVFYHCQKTGWNMGPEQLQGLGKDIPC